jgi:hypothetical protein
MNHHEETPMHARTRQLALSLGFALLALVDPALAEEDHLVGYQVKDLNRVAASPNPVAITNQFGADSCELKTPQLLLVRSEKEAGNDPRGGPAGEFVCYKAKCTAPIPPDEDVDSQFGLHALDTKKVKMVCLPVAPPAQCGDGVRQGSEQCDGADTGSCPAACDTDCTCLTKTIFVTSQTFTANLGGIAGADLTDGTLGAPITLDENGQTPPSVTHPGSGGQTGIWVWTNTLHDGTDHYAVAGYCDIVGPPCAGWSSASSPANAGIGKANSPTASWSYVGGGACSQSFHLYCVEQ